MDVACIIDKAHEKSSQNKDNTFQSIVGVTCLHAKIENLVNFYVSKNNRVNYKDEQ